MIWNSLPPPISADKRKPRYEHDCSTCIFLEQYKTYDLYYCPIGKKEPTPHVLGGSVIARYSSVGSEYTSGDFAILLSGAIRELAYGVTEIIAEGEKRIPPRNGAPLYVAMARILDKELVSVRYLRGSYEHP